MAHDSLLFNSSKLKVNSVNKDRAYCSTVVSDLVTCCSRENNSFLVVPMYAARKLAQAVGRSAPPSGERVPVVRITFEDSCSVDHCLVDSEVMLLGAQGQGHCATHVVSSICGM